MNIMSFWRLGKRAPETALYDLRELLPQNVPDTTQPDDDVYNTDTCRKTESAGNGALSSGEKNFSVHRTYMNFSRPRKRAPETALYALRGRSMVEMLGVLAIIGVLSVGAISGYSQVMWKYKKNKQTEQINTLIHAVIRYKNDLRLNDRSIADSQTSIIPFLRKLGEVPVEMNLSGNHPSYDTVLVDSFNNSLVLYHHGTGYLGMYVDIHHKGYGSQICKNLIDIAVPFQHDINALLINSQQTGSHYISGAQNCQESEKCLQNLTLEDRDNYCRLCGETSYCYFYYIIY